MPPGRGLTRDARGVATYTIEDAPTRNALSAAALADLECSLAELARDPAVRIVVVTGAGTTFSSGADRGELGDRAALDAATSALSAILGLIEASPVPVLARVNGAAFGAGLAIAAAADISVATTDGVFGLPEVRLGLVPGPAAAACLPRMGRTAALDLFLTGRSFDAAQGYRAGLFSAVVDRADLDAAVAARVADLLLGDPAALAATRRLVRQAAGPGPADRVAGAAAPRC